MTTHFADITVASDPESSPAQLLGALYARLHLALAQQQWSSIGVSFPEHSTHPRALGKTLRLHGTEADLRKLLATDWIKGVRDHVRFKGITQAPADASHRTVQRKQFKTSAERLRRRRMRRKCETAAQAESAIPDCVAQQPSLPFVRLRSRSTGQAFCLFVALGPLQPTAVVGRFNSYGLSSSATVPWF